MTQRYEKGVDPDEPDRPDEGPTTEGTTSTGIPYAKPESLLDRLPPDLKKDVEGLRRHEEKVLQALKDPQMSELFRRDPSAALAKMGVPLPAGLRAKLRAANMSALDFTQPRAFKLPNGQTVTARVRVNFTR